LDVHQIGSLLPGQTARPFLEADLGDLARFRVWVLERAIQLLSLAALQFAQGRFGDEDHTGDHTEPADRGNGGGAVWRSVTIEVIGEESAPEPSAFPSVGTRRPAAKERTGRR